MTESPEPSLRMATAADSDAVRSCVIAAYSQYVELMDQTPAPMLDDYETLIDDGVVRVAIIDGQLKGAIVLWPRDGYMYIDNIAVLPDAQGTGVGGALLDLADDECRDASMSELRLYTNEVMSQNVSYYPRRGYVETHRAIDDGYRRIYFSRKLEPGDS